MFINVRLFAFVGSGLRISMAGIRKYMPFVCFDFFNETLADTLLFWFVGSGFFDDVISWHLVSICCFFISDCIFLMKY